MKHVDKDDGIVKYPKEIPVYMVRELQAILGGAVDFVLDSHVIASTVKEREGMTVEGLEMPEEDIAFTQNGYRYFAVDPLEVPPFLIGICVSQAIMPLEPAAIRRLSELLLRDKLRSVQLQAGEGLKRNFVEQWLFDSGLGRDESFVVRGLMLGIDVNRPRTVCILQFRPEEHGECFIDTDELRKVYQDAQRVLQNLPDVLLVPAGQKLTILYTQEEGAVMENLAAVRKVAANRYHLAVRAGLSRPSGGYLSIQRCYANAEVALAIALRKADNWRFVYDESSMDLIVQSIPLSVKENFLSKVFENCAESDVVEWVQITQLLFANNGSISKTAEALHMHKNTLQYRIGKIIEKTGYDPRHSQDALTLHMALLIFESLRG